MSVPLDAKLTRTLILERWGSVDELAGGWLERVEEGFQKFGKARDRATIYRWLDNGLPNRPDELFGFCAALDVDPVALLDLNANDFTSLFARERTIFLLNNKSRSALSAVWQLIRPSAHWPDLSISHDYYGREWTVFDFIHDAKKETNVYAQIKLNGKVENELQHSTQILYFAYRRAGARDGLWRPYGAVRRIGEKVECIAENGERNFSTIDSDSNFDAETFFGPGPAEFRIASLHPFAATVTVPSTALAPVRFPG